MENINELKKQIYKENKKATFVGIKNQIAYYEVIMNDGTTTNFHIHCSDMGNAWFTPLIEAKLLIRWIDNVNYDTN